MNGHLPRRIPDQGGVVILSVSSRFGPIGVKLLPPPHHFANRILVSATDVSEDVSSHRPHLLSPGFYLPEEWNEPGGATRSYPGRMDGPGILAYAAAE